jgi:hypothetical protein
MTPTVVMVETRLALATVRLGIKELGRQWHLLTGLVVIPQYSMDRGREGRVLVHVSRR